MNRNFFYLLILVTLLTKSSFTQDETFLHHWSRFNAIAAPESSALSKGIAGPLTGVLKDKLFIAGGTNFAGPMPWQGGKKSYYSDVFLVGQNEKGFFSSHLEVSLPTPVAYAAVCFNSEGILYAGGENEYGLTGKVYFIQWDAEKESIRFSSLPSLPEPLANASAAFVGDLVFVSGGETARGTSDAFYCLDTRDTVSGWTQLPNLPKPVSHHVLMASKGNASPQLYLVGGRRKTTSGISELFSAVYAYDPVLRRWTEKSPMPFALSALSGLVYDEDRILIFGGDRGTVFSKVEALIAAIAVEKDPASKDSLDREKVRLQSTHPGFNKEVLQYDSRLDHWHISGKINFDAPVTTHAVYWKGFAILPCGEIRPGVRTPYILYHKLTQQQHD